jgi:hypothetical protein
MLRCWVSGSPRFEGIICSIETQGTASFVMRGHVTEIWKAGLNHRENPETLNTKKVVGIYDYNRPNGKMTAE